MSIRISVINFKGGVGKTTLSFHLACYLAQHGRTLLVDVDHQSSLSIVSLGANIWEQSVEGDRTINTVFKSFCTRDISLPGIEIIVPHSVAVASTGRPLHYSNLSIAPAAFELDDTEIDLASTNYGNPLQSEWEKRTILCNWLDKIGSESRFDFIVFDCPPATKIVSQNALIASDWYVVPVIPDALSSRGVSHFKALVDSKIDARMAYLRDNAHVPRSKVPLSFSPSTKLAAIVPSMAKAAPRAESGLTDLHTHELNAMRSRWGNRVTETVIRNKIGVAEAMQYGLPVWAWQSQNISVEVHEMMVNACFDVFSRITKK